MSRSPLLRTGSRLLILIILSIGLWSFVRPSNMQQGVRLLPVTIRKPDGDGEIIPVELRCEPAELSAPNSIDKLICILKNNSDRSIVAGTVTIWVTVMHQGKKEIVSTYDSFDTFLHPDFHNDHQSNSIPPGGEYRLDQLSTNYGQGVVNEISETIDYIEFGEGRPAGPDVAGSRLISDTREGAAKYKTWLARKFRRNPTSVNSIVEILNDSDELPQETGLQNNTQKQGANMLRKYFLRVYASEGNAGLVKRLN